MADKITIKDGKQLILDIKKLMIDTNKETYLMPVIFFELMKKRNSAPIDGKRISEEIIGKFII